MQKKNYVEKGVLTNHLINMRPNKRTPEELKQLSKDVVEYYFNNPHANSSKYMQEKFKASEKIIRDILSAEFERRLENSITRRMLNK